MARELRVLNAEKIVSSINYVANLDNHLHKYETGHLTYELKKNGLKTKHKTRKFKPLKRKHKEKTSFNLVLAMWFCIWHQKHKQQK